MLEGGRVVEHGTPQELLSRPGGRFAELWAKQHANGNGTEGIPAGSGSAEEAGQ